jgi:hypothetical protein
MRFEEHKWKDVNVALQEIELWPWPTTQISFKALHLHRLLSILLLFATFSYWQKDKWKEFVIAFSGI